MRHYLLLPAAGALLAAAPAAARVVAATPQGFEISETVMIAAPPARVYAALGEIGRWWDGAHTYSGAAANLTLELRAGGCMCEHWGKGASIEHLRIVYADPGRALRGRGGLGPMQDQGADGALSWLLAPSADGTSTSLTQVYRLGGYVVQGPAELAPLVDQVMSAQLDRLRRYVETGSPAGK